jgi:CO/xanthine dehydrogenase FAD-binding subunit
MAARTIGSPQIRNRGTVAGNLATASPAGDAHPPLLATRARIEMASVKGTRIVDVDDFFVGPKRNTLDSDELIRAVLVPVARGPQQFAKVGPRNAMVIATASFAVALDVEAGTVGTGVGSAAPTPFRATRAEQFAEERLAGHWDTAEPADPAVLREFGRLVAAAASPIDDVRGTADYRRHALSVLAARCLGWAWSDRPLEKAA